MNFYPTKDTVTAHLSIRPQVMKVNGNTDKCKAKEFSWIHHKKFFMMDNGNKVKRTAKATYNMKATSSRVFSHKT